MNNSCKNNREKISFLIDGELQEEETRSLKHHLEECKICKAYMHNLLIVRKSVKLLPKVSVTPSFQKRLESKLRRNGTGAYALPVRTSMWFRQAVAAVIAASILIVAIIALSNIGKNKTKSTNTPPGTDQAAIAPAKESDFPGTFIPAKEIQKEKYVSKEKTEEIKPVDEAVVENDAPELPENNLPDDFTPDTRHHDETLVDKQLDAPDGNEKSETKIAETKGESKTSERQPEENDGIDKLKDKKQELAVNLKGFEKKFFLAGKSGNSEEQIEMLYRLIEAPSEEAYKFLKQVLTQPSKRIDPSVRREAVFALAEIGTKKATSILLFVYGDVDWHVSDAVPKAISQIKRKDTLEWLAREVMVSSKSAGIRRMLAEALAQTEEPISPELFGAALAKESKVSVKVSICKALGATGDIAAEEHLIKAINDSSWLVREASLRALSKVGTMECVSEAIRSLNDSNIFVKEAAASTLGDNPDVRAVAPLVRILVYNDIRLRGAVLTALWRITGKRFTKQSDWRAWLKKMGKYPETDIDPAATPPAPGEFLNIPLWSKSVIYLVDASGSMRNENKIKALKQLVKDSLVGLPEETRFNIIFFSSSVRAFSQTSFPRADQRIKLKALNWLEKVRLPEGKMTNFYNALTMVLRNRPDDVIIISDGIPTEGRYVHPTKLVREISDLNLQQKTRLHTVGFYNLQPTEGATPVPVGPSVDFLKDLAERNSGKFIYHWFNTGGK